MQKTRLVPLRRSHHVQDGIIIGGAEQEAHNALWEHSSSGIWDRQLRFEKRQAVSCELRKDVGYL